MCYTFICSVSCEDKMEDEILCFKFTVGWIGLVLKTVEKWVRADWNIKMTDNWELKITLVD